MATCPICNGETKPRAQNATFPFCSARCKTIDLGKWLSEDYRMPVEGSEHEDPGAAEDAGSPSKGDVRN